MVLEGFVAAYVALPPLESARVRTLRTAVLGEGALLEEACLALGWPRACTAVALSGSTVGVVRRVDLSALLAKNPAAAAAVAAREEGRTSVTRAAEALMRDAPSALFRRLPPEYAARLSLRATLAEPEEGEVLLKMGAVRCARPGHCAAPHGGGAAAQNHTVQVDATGSN